MIDPIDLMDCVIAPVLKRLKADSPDARNLMLGTALAESGLVYLRQRGGPALGLWQMEPETHDDIWTHFISGREELHYGIIYIADVEALEAEEMTFNLRYACAMARVEYLRVPDPIPSAPVDQADYWVRFYNRGGAGTVEHYMEAWNSVSA